MFADDQQQGCLQDCGRCEIVNPSVVLYDHDDDGQGKFRVSQNLVYWFGVVN